MPSRVLDAGCALNGHIPDGVTASVFHLTQHLASERLRIPDDRRVTRSYVAGDLRNLNLFANGAFHRTVCVSTLEHVGLDNTGYGGPAETAPQTMLRAVHELCRVSRAMVFITVPFCEEVTANSQWRFLTCFDLDDMALIAEAQGYKADIRFYARLKGGNWYGGGPPPVRADAEGFPGSVNAIACLKLTR
jgi:hypothetical protein